MTVTVDRGGVKGTLQRANVAIWESDGTTEVACNRYVNNGDDVSVGFTSLTVGNTYYISVDNNYSYYRGTFTLCVDNTTDYDYYEGAIEVQHAAGWCSADAEYTTIGATPDRNAASCWNTSPNYNRWFYFVASSPFLAVTVDRGGVKGTLQRANVAIWESDGTTEVACNRYVNNGDDVSVGFTSLTVGNTYYIAVDNNYSYYRGTFTLCVDNEADYDYYEGAIELTDISNWCSTPGIYTTIGATPDMNAASCWNTSPNYNRWFKFQASATGNIVITVLRGGSYGTIQRINLALWESDGLTEVACNRYVNNGDDVTIQYAGLTTGNWYYISVDNNYSYYRGSFTLCLDDDRMRWNGNMDTDWDNPGNWSYAYVPESTDDVLLPTGLANYPLINTGADAEAGSILMEPGTQLTIPTGKSLTVSNEFTLEADASSMASLIDDGTLNNDPAQTTYECYLSEDQWHLVSSPVTDAKSDVFTSIYLKYFQESDSTWNYITSLTHDLTPGQGFSAWAASWITGDATVEYSGTFNTGDQTPPTLTYNPGSGTGDGWNLVGNPFPSSIEWNTNWTSSNIDDVIYVYDGTAGQYLQWNRATGLGTMPNGDIPPAQGFWVKVNGASATLTMPHSERKHSSQGFYKSSSDEAISLNVTGNEYSDKMIVHLNHQATPGFDSEFDGYKLKGIYAAPQIYSITPEAELTINSLPIFKELVIPIGFEVGAEGLYNLNATIPDWLIKMGKVYLEDKQEGKMIPLSKNPEYEFYANIDDEVDRFNLHIFKSEIAPNTFKSGEENELYIYSSEKNVFVILPETTNSEIQVYDLMGHLITSQRGESNTLNKISLTSKSGIYIVKVINEREIYSEKVFIK